MLCHLYLLCVSIDLEIIAMFLLLQIKNKIIMRLDYNCNNLNLHFDFFI